MPGEGEEGEQGRACLDVEFGLDNSPRWQGAFDQMGSNDLRCAAVSAVGYEQVQRGAEDFAYYGVIKELRVANVLS